MAVPLDGHHRDTAAEIAAEIAAEVRAGDVILVKGSLGVGMKAVIAALTDLDMLATQPRSAVGRG
jgi:UDP-N-acetylmuramoyl-tripeptide--D-alanyl-D-alanine ligase